MVTQTICLGCGKLVPVAPAFCVLCGDPLPLRMPVLVPTPGRHGQPSPTGGANHSVMITPCYGTTSLYGVSAPHQSLSQTM